MRSLEEILEIIRDFNGEITISQLLKYNIELDTFEELSYEEIHEKLEEYFEKDE